jgi:cyanophycinase-like exopeptidase
MADSGLPRLLVIMGSGETSPTMSKVHRELFARLDAAAGGSSVRAMVLDTPFGFQENADDIVAKAIEYFRESVNRDVTVASYRSARERGTLEHETAMARLREAHWVFSGPGSPSYALAQWRESQVPAILADKLAAGGCVIFASAAAVTLGPFALPVYEIYKVGAEPQWLEGLDLLAAVGLRAAVIPHFNNAEGGNHDTRFCYMGERRLRMLEEDLPDDVFVLGVDEHTALTLDIGGGRASVAGLGNVTIRRRGVVTARYAAGETLGIHCLAGSADDVADARTPATAATTVKAVARSPLLDDVALAEKAFADALGSGRDARAALASILQLDDLLVDWSRDTLQSDELDRARAALRSMIVRLGEAAEVGVRDPKEVVRPFVEALLDARNQARSEGRWADADALRDRLTAAGVEVRDTPAGSEWQVR